MYIPKHFQKLEYNHLINLIHTHNILIKPSSIKFKIQKGGGYKKIQYKGYTFNLSVSKEDDRTHILILTPKKDECVTVFIDSSNAIIHNMSYYQECAQEGLKKPGGGSILLNFIINYLKDNKKKYKIKRILLTDYSYLTCYQCDENVKLARLRFVTHGQSWYMKHGFLPYDTLKQKPDTVLSKGIKLNQEIREQLKTKQINIINLARNFKGIDTKEIKILMTKYTLMKDFIIRLTKEFNKYCCLIEKITQQIFDPPLLEKKLMVDYYDKPFYLDI